MCELRRKNAASSEHLSVVFDIHIEVLYRRANISSLKASAYSTWLIDEFEAFEIASDETHNGCSGNFEGQTEYYQVIFVYQGAKAFADWLVDFIDVVWNI